jgi:hypothetical protein
MSGAFREAMHDAGVEPGRFAHRDHVRVAWLLLARHGFAAGEEAFAAGLRAFASAHGAPERYHETLTRFWLRLVAHAMRARPEIADPESFVGAVPLLLDKSLPERHWSRSLLWSETARREFAEPDLLPLPTH